MDRLEKCRKIIDEIDGRIITLLNYREEVVKEIARCKVCCNMEIEQPEREREIYNKTEREYMQRIFEIIMGNSKEIQRKEVERGSKNIGMY